MSVPGSPRAAACINRCIQSQVAAYCRLAEGALFKDAVVGYCYAKEMGYPFNPYALDVQYTVTYNDNCRLSVYRDAYRYTGGAHGVTPRASDTFDLESGRRLCLAEFFPCVPHWPSALLGVILAQAEAAMTETPELFFENYRELILRWFKPESFYLTAEGITVYYQQYDIGPYAIGIVEFTAAWDQVGAKPPACGC